MLQDLTIEPSDAAPATEADFLTLLVQTPDGARFAPPAAAGFTLMELIRAFGLPIKAECGGSGVCATCHVRVGRGWVDRLPEPSADELAKLDEIPDADDRSRLACQIAMTEALDGLEVTLAPESLKAQTYWVAG